MIYYRRDRGPINTGRATMRKQRTGDIIQPRHIITVPARYTTTVIVRARRRDRFQTPSVLAWKWTIMHTHGDRTRFTPYLGDGTGGVLIGNTAGDTAWRGVSIKKCGQSKQPIIRIREGERGGGSRPRSHKKPKTGRAKRSQRDYQWGRGRERARRRRRRRSDE